MTTLINNLSTTHYYRSSQASLAGLMTYKRSCNIISVEALLASHIFYLSMCIRLFYLSSSLVNILLLHFFVHILHIFFLHISSLIKKIYIFVFVFLIFFSFLIFSVSSARFDRANVSIILSGEATYLNFKFLKITFATRKHGVLKE